MRFVIVHLLIGNLDLSRVNALDDVVRGLSIDGAANALGSAEDLLDGA